MTQRSTALCCTCASVRTVEVRKDGTYRPPAFDYERATCDLKCRPCGQVTRHALLVGDNWPRHAEHRPLTRDTTSAPAQS